MEKHKAATDRIVVLRRQKLAVTVSHIGMALGSTVGFQWVPVRPHSKTESYLLRIRENWEHLPNPILWQPTAVLCGIVKYLDKLLGVLHLLQAMIMLERNLWVWGWTSRWKGTWSTWKDVGLRWWLSVSFPARRPLNHVYRFKRDLFYMVL